MKMSIQTQIAQHQDEVKTLGSKIKKKSTKFPPLHTNSNIWAFLAQTTKKVEKATLPRSTHANLTYAQRVALDNLSNQSEMVIKPSDKGRNVVIMGELFYRNMCWDILKNRSW